MMRLMLIALAALTLTWAPFIEWMRAKPTLVPLLLHTLLQPACRRIGVCADWARRVVVLPRPSLCACHIMMETRAVKRGNLRLRTQASPLPS